MHVDLLCAFSDRRRVQGGMQAALTGQAHPQAPSPAADLAKPFRGCLRADAPGVRGLFLTLPLVLFSIPFGFLSYSQKHELHK